MTGSRVVVPKIPRDIYPNFSTGWDNVLFQRRPPLWPKVYPKRKSIRNSVPAASSRTVRNDRCAVSGDDEEEDQGKTRGRNPGSDSKDSPYFLGCPAAVLRPLPPRLRLLLVPSASFLSATHAEARNFVDLSTRWTSTWISWGIWARDPFVSFHPFVVLKTDVEILP